MKNKMQHKRLAAGIDAGKLRLSMEITLSEVEECYLARAFNEVGLDEVENNLRRGARRRGAHQRRVGPVANAASNRVLDLLTELFERGRQKAVLSKPKEKL